LSFTARKRFYQQFPPLLSSLYIFTFLFVVFSFFLRRSNVPLVWSTAVSLSPTLKRVFVVHHLGRRVFYPETPSCTTIRIQIELWPQRQTSVRVPTFPPTVRFYPKRSASPQNFIPDGTDVYPSPALRLFFSRPLGTGFHAEHLLWFRPGRAMTPSFAQSMRSTGITFSI